MTAPVPDLYYLENFRLLIRHACSTYADLLSDTERAFLATFAGLGLSAQCLYLRLLTRRGAAVRSDRLHYVEIANVTAAADELAAAGFVSIDPTLPAPALLAMLTMAELAPLALTHGGSRTLRKPELIAVLAVAGDAECASLMREHWHWYSCVHRDIVDTLLLLFFGNRQQDLSVFVLAQLGLLRFENYMINGLRQFADRDDFNAYRSWLDRGDAVQLVIEANDLPGACALAEICLGDTPHAVAPHRRGRLLMRLSRFCERQGHIEMALRLADACTDAGGDISAIASGAAHSDEAAHRARLMRARHRLADINVTAGSPPTRHRRPRPPTVVERPLLVRAWQPGGAEQLVLNSLTESGCRGAHWENHFPGALFGLLCWDIIFAPVLGAFFNAYQAAPADLYTAAFRARRAEAFQARLNAVACEREDWRARLADTYLAKHGIANAFVAWRRVPLQPLREFSGALPSALAAAICDRLCTDPRRFRRGFPDLSLLTPNGELQFCEVKSPNDQLSAAQRDWLSFLRSFGSEAWVARLVTSAADAAAGNDAVDNVTSVL